MRIENILHRTAQRLGRKTVLIAGEKRLSYCELDDLSDRLAAALWSQGITRGDRVLVFMGNCWEAAVAIYAILKAGAVFSPINASTKSDKLAYIIENCRAKAIITQERLTPVAIAALGTGRTCELIVAGRGDGAMVPGVHSFTHMLQVARHPVPHGGIDVDLAMLIYTSGSTGRPKGVMMNHRSIEAAATSITTYVQNVENDIILNVLPLAFDYGLYQLFMSVCSGATLVLEPSFGFPQAIFDIMRRERVTGFPLVPTMAALILQMRNLEPGFLPDLRYVTNTAAALPPAHIARLRELFPNVRLYSMYGLTECKRCTYLPPEELDQRPGSVGIAIPNTEAFIVDEAGKPVGTGTIGELVIRGPHVMQGYWENDEATSLVLKPGFNKWEKVLYTGDLFSMDRDGYFYFVGRKDDIIKTRGEKVAPKEVEAILHSCPGIAEAVVIGVDEPVLGQAIRAIVVRSDPALTDQEIIRYCAKNMEDFMVPKSVEFRSSLPRTDTGKVSRRLAAESQEN